MNEGKFFRKIEKEKPEKEKKGLTEEGIKRLFLELKIEIQPTEKDKEKIVVEFNPEEIKKLTPSDFEGYKKETLLEIIPDRFRKNIENFKIDPFDWKIAALKQPSLFYQKLETLKNNVEGSAKRLDFSNEEFVEICLRGPGLFYASPITLENKFSLMTRFFFEKEEETKEFIKKRPSNITYSPEKVILHYIARKIIAKKEKVSFAMNPINIIRGYFPNLEIAPNHLEKTSKEIRKKIKKVDAEKKRKGEKILYTETNYYQKLTELTEKYFGKKEETFEKKNPKEIEELFNQITQDLKKI